MSPQATGISSKATGNGFNPKNTRKIKKSLSVSPQATGIFPQSDRETAFAKNIQEK
ncbi:MAG: hypothetical protein LIO41_00335 [Ruminococcus sp.]|nr:hypothetical protein [Ruminococcus sp.]